jgi:hypothetical protein
MSRGVYGIGSAGDYLRECVRGINSLDIVIVGDSNSGYNGGYGNGWNEAMVAAGAPLYGTGIIACAYGSTGASITTWNNIGITVANGRYAGQSGGSAFLLAGSSEGISEIDDRWNNGGGGLKPYNVALDWMSYSDQGGNPDVTQGRGISILTTCSVPPSANWISRVGSVAYDSGDGYWVSRWIAEASPYTTLAARRIPTDPHLNRIDIVVQELELGEDPSRNFNVRAARYTDGNSGGLLDGFTMSEPAGFVFESVYVRRKGFAVTQLQRYSGATTSTLADGVAASGATVVTHLREIRERQIAAGGRGRVLVWLNAGINGGPAVASDWTDGAETLRDDMRAAWSSLGYEPSDLQFLFSVTHPDAALDSMAATRTAAQSWVDGKDDTVFVDLAEMVGYDYLNDNALYDALGNAHLTSAGYVDVVGQIINNITEPTVFKDLTIHNYKSTGGTAWVAANNLPAEPGVLIVSASSDFQFGYSDTEPVNNYLHVESNGKMPLVVSVEDMSKVWFKTPSGGNAVTCMSYPPGFGPIPYA